MRCKDYDTITTAPCDKVQTGLRVAPGPKLHFIKLDVSMRRASLALITSLFAASATASNVHRDVVYARTPQKQLLLDLHIPAGSGPFPVVLYIHGGGWSSGSKDNPPVERLVRRGYAVASINYRLSHEAKFPAQIHDCKAAVRWLRANARQYSLDTSKIVAWGGSAGGHLVALLATSGGVQALEGDLGNPAESSRVQGAIDFFGPTDFFQLNAARKYKRPDTDSTPEARLVGGLLSQHRDAVVAANPITYLTKDDPPLLILHGDQDDLVPPHQSELLAGAAKQAGVSVQYHLLPARGHGFRTGRDVDSYVDQFLASHLAPPAVEQFTRFEATLSEAVEHVTFTSPSGRRYDIPTFSDGAGMWRVRFSPN